MFEDEYVHSRTAKVMIVLLQALIAAIEWLPKKFDEAFGVLSEMKLETITLYGVFAVNLAFIALVLSMAPTSHPDLVTLVTSKLSEIKF